MSKHHDARPPQSLASTYVHLPDDRSALGIAVDDAFWPQLIAGGRPELERGRLVMQFDFSSNWGEWERHPAGEELVILLSGAAELLLELPDGTSRMKLALPGDFVIVPRGVWHTAHTKQACSMLFVTHGPGTEHRAEA